MFSFNPVTGLNDASQFPAKDPLIRQHLQSLLQQMPTYMDAELVHKKYDVLTPTLVNGWVNSGVPYETAKYWKDELGIVHLEGTVGSGTSAAIFTLPIGYRPLGAIYFPHLFVDGTSSWVPGMINITSAGVVQHMNVPVDHTVALNGITFLAEQ